MGYFTAGKAGSVNSNSDKDLITIEGDKSDEEDYEIAVTLRIGQYLSTQLQLPDFELEWKYTKEYFNNKNMYHNIKFKVYTIVSNSNMYI